MFEFAYGVNGGSERTFLVFYSAAKARFMKADGTIGRYRSSVGTYPFERQETDGNQDGQDSSRR